MTSARRWPPGAPASTLDDLNARIARAPTSALYSARGAEHLKNGQLELAFDDYSAAIRLRLDDAVEFTGWIPREQVYEKFASAYAFFYPTRFEGFGLPLVEVLEALREVGAPVARFTRGVPA